MPSGSVVHRWLIRCKGDCWGERVDTWCSDLAAGIPPVYLRATEL